MFGDVIQAFAVDCIVFGDVIQAFAVDCAVFGCDPGVDSRSCDLIVL